MKPFAWSYSALTTYELCPKKYFHLYVAEKGTPERVKDEDTSWSAEGKEVHEAMKARVINGKPLPLPMRHNEKIAKRFADTVGEKHGEMKLALTREFEPCDYFAPRVWVRVAIDLAIIQPGVGIVVDWKTGKKKDDPTQIGLCTAVLSRWMPELNTFRTAFVWLQSNDVTPKVFTLSDLTGVWNNLLPRVAKMEEARKTTEFPAKKNGLCPYCPVHMCPFYVARAD